MPNSPDSTPEKTARAIVSRYYAAFNAGDHAGMLALLAEDVAHDVNQGARETGRAAFAEFLKRMEKCYAEELREIVIFAGPEGTRAAAEFVVHGRYLATDEGLPPAAGQTYVLPAGAFLSLTPGGLISRVTMYYNLQDWLRQVGG